MRIEKVILKNYRQLRNVVLTFDKNSDNDIHIVIGRNGTGKTNFLNAINWCLYKKEPHLSKDQHQLPLLNLQTIEEETDRKIFSVMVEIWTVTEDNINIVFTRNVSLKLSGKKNIKIISEKFEVKVIGEDGNTEPFEGEKADAIVEQFVPEGIKEFFFFDGERLDNYFKEATGQKISNAIFEISHINLLNRLEEKLEEIWKDLNRDAGKKDPNIDTKIEELDDEEERYKDTENQINQCNNQIELARQKIKDSEEYLRNFQEIEKEQSEKERLRSSIEKDKKTRNEKVNEKKDYLLENGKGILLYPNILKTINIISEKRKKGEIPPTCDIKLLQEILKKQYCSVCGRKLDNKSEQNVINLSEDIKLTSEIGNELNRIEFSLYEYEKKAKTFKKELTIITQEIKKIENSINNMEERVKEIDKKISGIDIKKIKEYHSDLQKYESLYDTNQRRFGLL